MLLARMSRKDAHHDTARRIVEAADHGDLPTMRVTNYVVTETLNYLHERQEHDVAVELYDRLVQSAGFEPVHTPKADFSQAVDLFRENSGLAFGDAAIVACMQREDIEYVYSFDDDFDPVTGVTRLNTATNPFSP
ncbi:type II toxin-antitoxin system VapC family toxin [Halomarina salina]|uniref:type II toxin-antitoxin system VapC family toxin n=1 Tax=Halomarina salina TaxID=1872699 RepID=UPI0036D3D5E9